MPPRNQSLLCACLVLAAALGWILHESPKGDETVAWSGAAASGEENEEPPPAAVVIPVNKITEPPAAPKAPQFAQAPLPGDFLRRILSADEKTVTIPLPDGGSVAGRVSLIRRDANGLLLVQGAVTRPEAGRFMFQRQTLPGKAGTLVGYIYYDRGDEAWQVRPLGENGAPVLVKTTVDEVICRAYAAPPEVEEIPAAHPTDYPIPPDENGVIQLQSLPGAEAVIYLDFDGEERNFDSWGYINAAPSGAGNAQIFEVWQGVCEDYQPFQINVTTIRAVYDAALPGRRMQVIVTPTDDAYPGAGGVAIIGSFNWTGEMVCWAFSTTGKNAVEIISHEAGHTLGLSHDGRISPYEEYYQGRNGWAPIMGVGYYQALTQWSKGEYPNANNDQDDLQIITTDNNGVAYRGDDHGASSTTSSWLDIASGGAVSNEGIIETRNDRDSFRFSTTGGVINLRINPVTYGNLDIKAELLSVTSTLITTIATRDPANSLAASFFGMNLPAGDYLLRISGTGKGEDLDTGYSDYASLGSYTVTGTINGGVHSERFTLAENATNGSAVGTVAARADHDGGTLSFAIDSSDADGAFSINPATGAITVADTSLLDFEALSSRWDDPAVVELFVAITDDLEFATEIIRVAIDLTNVNEPPDFPLPAAVLIPDTLPLGMTVAAVTAADPDQGDFVAYSIVAGNEGGHFAIDPDTGVITLTAPLDYLAMPVHQLTLRATDHLSPGNEVDVPLTVSLIDVVGDVVTGSVVRTFYSGIDGADLTDLTGNPMFPDKPNSEVILESFDSGTGQGVSYGSTVRGYLVAPATGDYTFWVSADDAGELLISPDTNPANAAPCASIGSPADPGEWTSQPSQQSAAIGLTAGEVYYIEARHKQETGGDHIQVAWQGPGMTGPEIIPGLWLAPFHQQHAPWAYEMAATVREDAAEGTLVRKVSSSFVEPNIGEEIASYDISAGNEDGFFTIDPLDGEIRVAAGAALVAGNPHVLTVSATDNGSPAATGYATVNITVTGVDENLYAWWRLDEAAGVSLADSSGNDRQAWLVGNGSWMARSPANPALQLNGGNSYFEYYDFEALYGAQPFTVAAWVKVPVTHASEGVLIQQLDPTAEFGPGRYDVAIASDGRVRFSLYGWDQDWNDLDSQFEITSPQAIHDGEWHHVACVRDGQSGRIFIDGVESAVGTGTIRMLEFESSTVVGHDASSGSAFLDAAVDDVRIYAEALVGPQIIKVASMPVFSADPITGDDANQDSPYIGTLATFASDPNAADTLVFTKTDGPEWLIVAGDGTLSGTPTNDDVGSNIFTVRVTDLAGAFVQTLLEITVQNVNDAPEFSVAQISGDAATQDSSYTGTLATFASDPDVGDALTFSKTAGPEWLSVAEDGTLSGTPTNDDVGSNIFTVRVTDLAGAFVQTLLEITVQNVNDPPAFSVDPIIAGDATALAAYSGTLAGSASDPDIGDTLTFAKTDGPGWLIVNEDGSLSGTPADTDAGINLFAVSVTDSLEVTSSAALQITVLPPPVVSVDASDPIAAETGPETGAFTITRSGSTDGDLTVDFTFNGTAVKAVDYVEIPGSVIIPDGQESVTITVIPTSDELIEGTETVALVLSEGPYELGEFPTAFVSIRDSNHAPFFLADPVVAPAALVGVSYTGESLADHASDPNLDDGDSLSFEKTDGPEWLIVAGDGTLSGTPGNDDVGSNIFAVRVTDAKGLFADGTLQINITVPSPYESWQLTEFGGRSNDPLVAGESADPDQDKLSNLLEYALGTDPNQPDAAHIEMEMVDIAGTAYMRLTYFINPAATDIDLIVEGTDDFTNPASWSGPIPIEEVTTARIVVRDTVGGLRRFFRLRVNN